MFFNRFFGMTCNKNYFFAIIWLMLGFFGVLELFGFGSIANFAHLGGLIGGIIYATILNIVNLKT